MRHRGPILHDYENCLLVIHPDIIAASVCATLQAIGHMSMGIIFALELQLMSQATFILT